MPPTGPGPWGGSGAGCRGDGGSAVGRVVSVAAGEIAAGCHRGQEQRVCGAGPAPVGPAGVCCLLGIGRTAWRGKDGEHQ